MKNISHWDKTCYMPIALKDCVFPHDGPCSLLIGWLIGCLSCSFLLSSMSYVMIVRVTRICISVWIVMQESLRLAACHSLWYALCHSQGSLYVRMGGVYRACICACFCCVVVFSVPNIFHSTKQSPWSILYSQAFSSVIYFADFSVDCPLSMAKDKIRASKYRNATRNRRASSYDLGLRGARVRKHASHHPIGLGTQKSQSQTNFDGNKGGQQRSVKPSSSSGPRWHSFRFSDAQNPFNGKLLSYYTPSEFENVHAKCFMWC